MALIYKNRNDEMVRTYLKKIKVDNGYTTATFAEACGISKRWQQEMESDRDFSTAALVEYFVKVSAICHISVYDLMCLETEFQLKKIEVDRIRGEETENDGNQ